MYQRMEHLPSSPLMVLSCQLISLPLGNCKAFFKHTDSLHPIPGSAARLTRTCLGADNLLLLYAYRMGRPWNVQTQEFSMTSKTADGHLQQAGWFEA